MQTPLLILVFLSVTFALSACLTRAAIYLAPYGGFVDRPDGARKLHSCPIPVTGGLAYITTLVAASCAWHIIANITLDDSFPLTNYIPSGISLLLFALVGALDDRVALTPRAKLAGQAIASIPAAMSVSHIATLTLFGIEVPSWNMGPVVVFLLVVASSNCFNLIDGIDGLAGSLGCVAMLAIAAMAVLNNAISVALTAAIAFSALAGFLVFNLAPAKIFMGDAGSLSLGYLVAMLPILAKNDSSQTVELGANTLLFAIPAYDALIAILRRVLGGRNISSADRGHIHHRLLARGYSPASTALIITGLSLGVAIFLVLGEYLQQPPLGIIAFLAIAIFLASQKLFGYDELSLLKRNLLRKNQTNSSPQQIPILATSPNDAIPINANQSKFAEIFSLISRSGNTSIREVQLVRHSGHDKSSRAHLLWRAASAHVPMILPPPQHTCKIKLRRSDMVVLRCNAEFPSSAADLQLIAQLAALIDQLWTQDATASGSSKAPPARIESPSQRAA